MTSIMPWKKSSSAPYSTMFVLILLLFFFGWKGGAIVYLYDAFSVFFGIYLVTLCLVLIWESSLLSQEGCYPQLLDFFMSLTNQSCLCLYVHSGKGTVDLTPFLYQTTVTDINLRDVNVNVLFRDNEIQPLNQHPPHDERLQFTWNSDLGGTMD